MRVPHSKPFISKEDVDLVAMQVQSGMHATGDKVKEFEETLANLIGKKYAKATTSGTTALHLSLLSLGIKKGDEVIMPDYVCQSLMHAIYQTGATPVLVDLDPDFAKKGYNISLKTIKPKVTKKTKAIIIPHMFGMPADIDEIKTLKIPVIEDCCQSLGALFNGEITGSMADISVFSFYATKIISTGQGGMVLTSDEKIKEKLDNLTTYDHREKMETSYNYGLTNIQAVLGSSQLSKLPSFIKRRKEIGERYDKEFSKLFTLPQKTEGSFPFRYVIQTKYESELIRIQEKLKEIGITVERPVYIPLHKYLDLDDEFPNSIKAYETALSIPLYPALKDEEVDYIIKSILEVAEGGKNVKVISQKA